MAPAFPLPTFLSFIFLSLSLSLSAVITLLLCAGFSDVTAHRHTMECISAPLRQSEKLDRKIFQLVLSCSLQESDSGVRQQEGNSICASSQIKAVVTLSQSWSNELWDLGKNRNRNPSLHIRIFNFSPIVS